MSTSGRRSGSSGPSKKRESVFISTSASGRARERGRGAAMPAPVKKPGRQSSARVVSSRSSTGKHRADELKAARERRLGQQRRGARLRVLGIAAAIMAVLAACAALYSSSLFSIKTVEVVGNHHISAAQVRALAQVPPNATLIRFPGSAVAKRVSASPWVAGVTVSRVFPSGMRIRVSERVPIAIVDAVDTMWLVDGSGMVIAKPTTETSETIPVIRDVPGLDPKAGRRTSSEPLLNAIKILVGIDPAIAKSVRSISAPTVDGAMLIRDDRIEIVIGEAVDLAKKSQLVERILADEAGKVVSIDVRVTDRPTWRGLK